MDLNVDDIQSLLRLLLLRPDYVFIARSSCLALPGEKIGCCNTNGKKKYSHAIELAGNCMHERGGVGGWDEPITQWPPFPAFISSFDLWHWRQSSLLLCREFFPLLFLTRQFEKKGPRLFAPSIRHDLKGRYSKREENFHCANFRDYKFAKFVEAGLNYFKMQIQRTKKNTTGKNRLLYFSFLARKLSQQPRSLWPRLS